MNMIMDDDNIIEYMERVIGVKYSDEQLKILKHKGGMCILASAGSGKTSVLNSLIAKRLQTGEIGDCSKLLCTTFSKAGADEMNTRLEKLLKDLGINKKVNVRTLHSVYFSLLRDLQYNLKVMDGGTRIRLIREAVKNCLKAGTGVDDETIITLDSILSYQVNNLMSDKDIFQSYVYTIKDTISLEKYTEIRCAFNAKKQEIGQIDFDDMQLMVYQLLRNETYGPQIVNYCHSLYQYIYIDEAQDISKIQFAILKKLVSDPNKLVIIGDDDQCIYQWRGADPSIILNICGTYPELTYMTLTTNYRCLSNIVNKAAYGIQFNPVRSDKIMKPFREGGTVKLVDCGSQDICTMSKYPYKYIKELVIDKGVSPNDIAVLCRNNQHLTILSNMLFKDGIFCRQSEDMRITKNYYFKMISGIIQLGGNTTNGNVTSANLKKCCRYMRSDISKDIGDIQKSYGLSLLDTLGFILTEYLHANVKWVNPGIKAGSLDKNRYTQKFALLNYKTLEDLSDIYDMLSHETSATVTKAMLTMFYESKQGFLFKNQDTDRFVRGLIAYISSLLDSMGYENFTRYIQTVERFENGEMAVIQPMVNMTTMHGAKGKEWKYVIIFADDNISFPSFVKINQNKESGVSDVDIRRMIDEDRRLHYVAFTRAKENLTIFGDKNNFGLYTVETLGVIPIDKNNDNNIMVMAQHGVNQDIKTAVLKELFSEESEYYLDINIKDLKTDVEIKYDIQREQKENSQFNINNMQTYAPINY